MELRDNLENPAMIVWILASLGTTWQLQERYAEAIAFWSQYITRYPEDAEVYSSRAAAHWYLGQLHEAIRDYSRALELKPADIPALCGRGQVLAEVGENDRALKDLDRALQLLKAAPRLGPEWHQWHETVEAYIRNGVGLALTGLGETKMSMDQFEASVTLSPDNAWVYYNRALAYDARGDWDKARSDYQLAVAKNGPALNSIRRELAQARLRELLNQ
jgi:tetratricopeptide (TPR) repeat protein